MRSSNSRVSSILGGAGVLLACLPVTSTQADIVYTFTGPNYQVASTPFNTAMNLTGSFTVANPIIGAFVDISGIKSFSFFDGVQTITNLDVDPLSVFNIGTDAAGKIVNWNIGILPNVSFKQTFDWVIFSNLDLIAYHYTCPLQSCSQLADFQIAGIGTNTPLHLGSWSDPIVTPLPATLPLFASGLGALGLIGWWRKRKAAA
jgi:hypothetical protein